MREKNERQLKLKERSVRFLAVAALSAALIGGQVPVAFAANRSSTEIEINDLIPDNITVDEPMTLADIELPEHKLGELKWMDDSIELTKRVQSCEVIFIPDKGVDLTELEGWDEEEGGVISHIHVVVSSIEAEDWEMEEWEEELGEATLVPNDSEMVEEDETEDDSETLIQDEVSEEEDTESETESEDNAGSDTEDKDVSEENKESGDEKEENTGADAKEETGSEEEKDSETDSESADDSETDNSTEEENDTEAELDDETNADGDTESEENNDSDTEEQEPSEETPSDSEGETPDNIFDNPSDFTEEDDRPTEAPEGLTEEEKLIQAQLNHSAEGISVSGINLPWYVQFRVTSGESHEFSNETDAMIFQSYEFELWDLQNNTEYMIPDGEYISVTVPVKEGYDYTIEHLLDNGASETIIPSVDGNVMVFSTHSFSPFGIAGSKQLVGPDFPIDDEVKPTPTITPTPAVTGKPGDNTGNNTGNNNGNNNGSNNTGNNNSSEPSTGDGNTANNSPADDGTDDYTGNSGNNGSDVTDGNSEYTNNANSDYNENNSQSVNNGKAVATGDTTAILPFVILILAAAVMIGAVVFIRKKK